jgi:hypothetical protein
MKIKIMFLGMFLLLSLMILPSIVHADASANVTIQVAISSVSALELNETTINYGSVAPAANSTVFDIIMTNTGSTTLSNVYAHVFTINNESSTTRGQAGTAYAATGFLTIKNGTAASTAEIYYYAGHQIWNTTTDDDPSQYTLTAITGVTNRSYGDLWIDGSGTSSLYYWQLLNGTTSLKLSSFCNESSAGFKLQTTRASKDVNGGTAGTNVGQNSQWSTFTFGSGPLTN